MPILYSLVGLVVAYFAFRAAGYAALALAFVAALVVGGQGSEGLLQFATVGIIVLLVVAFPRQPPRERRPALIPPLEGVRGTSWPPLPSYCQHRTLLLLP